MMQHDDFKDNQEGLAAREFLHHYNALHSTNFELINKQANVEPDFHSRDSKTGELLNFEVTLGTARQWIDVWRRLLSKESRNLNSALKSNAIEDFTRCPLKPGHTTDFTACCENIVKKFSKNYGRNCALVVYHFNSCSYAEDFIDDLRRAIDFTQSHYFDKGVWLVSTAEFHRIDEVGNQPVLSWPTTRKE